MNEVLLVLGLLVVAFVLLPVLEATVLTSLRLGDGWGCIYVMSLPSNALMLLVLSKKVTSVEMLASQGAVLAGIYLLLKVVLVARGGSRLALAGLVGGLCNVAFVYCLLSGPIPASAALVALALLLVWFRLRGASNLAEAIERRQSTPRIVRMLDQGADPTSALFPAVSVGNVEVVRLLLARGADPNGGQDGAIPLAASLSPLHSIPPETRGRLTRMLLEAGADPHGLYRPGTSLAEWGATWGEPDQVRSLVEAGVRVDGALLRRILEREGDDSQVSDLFVELLARVECLDADGAHLLLTAAQRGRAGAVRALLDRGVGTETRSEDGETPLLVAARCGHPAVVEVLERQGADRQARDLKGRGMQELASHPELAPRTATSGRVSAAGAGSRLKWSRHEYALNLIMLAAGAFMLWGACYSFSHASGARAVSAGLSGVFFTLIGVIFLGFGIVGFIVHREFFLLDLATGMASSHCESGFRSLRDFTRVFVEPAYGGYRIGLEGTPPRFTLRGERRLTDARRVAAQIAGFLGISVCEPDPPEVPTDPLPTPPPGCRIGCEASGSELVFQVPAKGRMRTARGEVITLAILTLIWLGLTLAVLYHQVMAPDHSTRSTMLLVGISLLMVAIGLAEALDEWHGARILTVRPDGLTFERRGLLRVRRSRLPVCSGERVTLEVHDPGELRRRPGSPSRDTGRTRVTVTADCGKLEFGEGCTSDELDWLKDCLETRFPPPRALDYAKDYD